jgi:hypothetical protein
MCEDSNKTEVQIEPEEKKELINVNNNMGLVPKNHEEMMKVVRVYHRSGMLPAHLNSPEKILTAMQFGSELGLKPLISLRQIAVVNGTPCVYGDLPLSLVQQSGKLEAFKEEEFDKNYNIICFENKNLGEEVFGVKCFVRRNDSQEKETYFTLIDAKRAGLLTDNTNSNKPWVKYTRYMLKYRARAQALKDIFPDALNGIAIAEYDFNEKPDSPEFEQRIKDANTAESIETIEF